MANATRSEKLDLRLAPEVVLNAAAQASRRSVSEFVLESALDRAREALPDRQHTTFFASTGAPSTASRSVTSMMGMTAWRSSPSSNSVAALHFSFHCYLATRQELRPQLFQAVEQKEHGQYTAEDLYDFLAKYDLTRTPGDTFEYFNLGVGLLGHALVLRAGGADYESLIRSRILAPLGMDDTVISIPPPLEGNVATGHDDNLDPVSNWNFDFLAAAGAFRSNLSDMLRFMDALCDPEHSPIGSMTSPLITGREQGGLGLDPTDERDVETGPRSNY